MCDICPPPGDQHNKLDRGSWGLCKRRCVIARRCYTRTFIGNDCRQTQPDVNGCDNEFLGFSAYLRHTQTKWCRSRMVRDIYIPGIYITRRIGAWYILLSVFCLSYILCSPFVFLPILGVTHTGGHKVGFSPSPPTTLLALYFYRDNSSSLSSHVGSRRTVPIYPRY